MSVEIIGSGHSLGESEVSNEVLYEQVSNFDEVTALSSLRKKNIPIEQENGATIFSKWVKMVSGIEKRPFMKKRVEKKLEVEQLAFIAAQKAMDNAKVNKDEIDQVVFSTYSSNRVMPSPACTLIDLLNLTQSSAMTINGACSGFLDALIDASIKVESGHFKTILVVAAEQLSNKMNFNDPKSSIIFSDGAGAFVITKKNTSKNNADKGVLSFASGSTFSEQIYMEREGHIYFNSGPLVERNAVRVMFSICEKAIAGKCDFSDIDFVIPHQANVRIINEFEKKINSLCSGRKPLVMKMIETLGNLSSATLPVVFDLLVQNHFANQIGKIEDKKILFVSVGGGYTFSSLLYQF